MVIHMILTSIRLTATDASDSANKERIRKRIKYSLI